MRGSSAAIGSIEQIRQESIMRRDDGDALVVCLLMARLI